MVLRALIMVKIDNSPGYRCLPVNLEEEEEVKKRKKGDEGEKNLIRISVHIEISNFRDNYDCAGFEREKGRKIISDS